MMPNSQALPKSGKLLKIPSLKENFGLTKEEFLECIQNMKSGDDSFITRNMATQLPESMAYLMNRFQISKEVAYDTCMDTFLIFREKLLLDKIVYGNLRYLFTRMCQNQFINGQKKLNRIQSAIDNYNDPSQSEDLDHETFYLILDKSITLLSLEEQQLIKQLYYSGKTTNEIAEEKNINAATLRKKKERVLKKLKTIYFEICNKTT